MKKVILSMMAVAALASCSKDNETPAPTTDPNEITLVSNTVGVETKAPIEAGELTGIARVLASETQGNYSTLFTGRTQENTYINFVGTTTEKGFVESDGTTLAPAYYKDATSSVYLFGLYPKEWALSGSNYECTFDGKTDVMFAPEISVTKSTTKEDRNLTFKHLLTLLEVKAKLSEGTADSWGSITSISLQDAKNKVSIANSALPNQAAAITGFSYSGTAKIPFYVWEASGSYSETALSNATMPENDTKINLAYVLCAPVEADGATVEEYTLNIVTTKGGTHNVKINLKDDKSANFNGSTSGYKFSIVLDFQSSEITATATVAAWGVGGETEAVVDVNTQA